jgi:menaquinone-dependent protoporphyrinogen oxidase
MSILVAFASKHGSTQEIAERITTRLRQMGKDVAIQSVQSVGDVRQYEAFVIGSAVYFGSWMKEATDFVRRNRDALAARPVWLFSSGPTGAASLPEPKEISELMTAVRPQEHREFSGRLDRHLLSFAERVVVKGVRAPEGDFRHWHAIDDWAENIARALAPSPMTPHPAYVAQVCSEQEVS